jgi:DNA polymerase I-like protein with 3'-5' exonuclease and polymerase domains
MAQIPRVGQPYGSECRALFYATPGWLLIGADASGLELRALGAQLAYFDGGEYAKLVSTPKFDIHTHNAKLFGIFDGKGEIDKKTRELAKRMIYAVLYGAGAKKLGSVLDVTLNENQQKELGYETINTFYKNLPAIKQLKDKVDERVLQRGYLTGIDGRHLQIRSRHSALNQLLQSTGAIAVKKATCILYKDLYEAGLRWACHFAFVAHIHDEIQALVKPQFEELYKDLAIDSFRKSGEYYNLKCPLTGEAKEGKNWMETH